MITFKITQDQIKNWFPITYQNSIDELRSSKSSSNDTSEDKIEWFLTWGFFVKKATTEEEKEKQKENYLKKMEMVYEDRVLIEMPKIRCSINMKAGYYYKMDRAVETTIPTYIEDMAKEVTKYMMFQEQQYIGNQEVMNSIKEFSDSMMQSLSNPGDEKSLELNDILDKINEKGIESLSAVEMEYLNKMSKSK